MLLLKVTKVTSEHQESLGQRPKPCAGASSFVCEKYLQSTLLKSHGWYRGEYEACQTL